MEKRNILSTLKVFLLIYTLLYLLPFASSQVIMNITVDPMLGKTNVAFLHTCKDNLGLVSMGYILSGEKGEIESRNFSVSNGEKEFALNYPFEFKSGEEGNYSIEFFCLDYTGNTGLNKTEFVVREPKVSADFELTIILENSGEKIFTEKIRYSNLEDYPIENPILPPSQLSALGNFTQINASIYSLDWTNLEPGNTSLKFYGMHRITLNRNLEPRTTDGIILRGVYEKKGFDNSPEKSFKIDTQRVYLSDSRVINSASYVLKIPKNRFLLGYLDVKDVNPLPDLVVDEGKYISFYFNNPAVISDTSGKIEWQNLQIFYSYDYKNWFWALLVAFIFSLIYDLVVGNNLKNLKKIGKYTKNRCNAYLNILNKVIKDNLKSKIELTV